MTIPICLQLFVAGYRVASTGQRAVKPRACIYTTALPVVYMDSDGDDRAEGDDENDPVGLGVYLRCRWQSASSGQLPDASGGFQRTRLRSHSPPVDPDVSDGSQRKRLRTHSPPVDPCELTRFEHFICSLEGQANPPSALCGERNIPRVVAACSGERRELSDVGRARDASDDESEIDDAVEQYELRHLIHKMHVPPRGSDTPRQPFSERDGQGAVIDAKCTHLEDDEPVEVNIPEYWQDCFDVLHRAVSSPSVRTFYVGATIDPRRRWNGAADDLWSGRGRMQGHCESYRVMILVALLMGSKHSRYVETELIREGIECYRYRCANTVVDGRGQKSHAPMCIYIVYD